MYFGDVFYPKLLCLKPSKSPYSFQNTCEITFSFFFLRVPFGFASASGDVNNIRLPNKGNQEPDSPSPSGYQALRSSNLLS